MKTIGLIGGMSWESSGYYYQLLNKGVKKALGGSHSAKVIMVSVDFADIERMTFAGDWDGIARVMIRSAHQLEKAGADVILLCTNTIHKVAEAISGNISVPFLHIADVTGRAVVETGLTKVGLLGTRFTMEEDFYTGYLKEHYGIETLIPEIEGRELLQRMIYDELVNGIFTDVARQQCFEMIRELVERGAQGIILGCTELPMLLEGHDPGVSAFDTTGIHADSALIFALETV